LTPEEEVNTIGQIDSHLRKYTLKEQYFTPNTIDARAHKMKQAAVGTRRGDRFTFVPERSALLVLDMQAYFLEAASHAYVPSASAILPRLRDLAAAYAERGLPVICTRHVNTTENARLMGTWWRELIWGDSPLSQIISEFTLSQGIVLEKSQYDAFYQTDLEERLRSLGINQVVVGGVMTHLCCETTARAAFGRGFEVFFLVDGTATYTAAYHRASLLNLAHGFAELKLVKEILESLPEVDAHA
jgi:bifunctional isochorismate lyase/aryl carrier protein